MRRRVRLITASRGLQLPYNYSPAAPGQSRRSAPLEEDPECTASCLKDINRNLLRARCCYIFVLSE